MTDAAAIILGASIAVAAASIILAIGMSLGARRERRRWLRWARGQRTEAALRDALRAEKP